MSDVHSQQVRSYNMSRIKGSDTRPEIAVRRYLHSKGLRYRLHAGKLAGKPDIVLKKYKTVIFVNGCFWHGHQNCRKAVIPKTRTEWWTEKISRNMERDAKAISELTLKGWSVIVVWECSLTKKQKELTLEKLYRQILGL